MSFLPFSVSYLIWSLWCLAKGAIPSPAFAISFVVDTAVKALVWLGPMLFYLLRKDEKWLVMPRKLFAPPFPWLPALVGVCLTAVFLHTAHILMVGIGTWGVFQPIYILMSLAAAVIEELAFRGFLFNRQAASFGVKLAAPVDGLLFALYHFPEFLAGRNFGALFGFRFWLLAVMGCLLSVTFAKWKHLGVPMLIHFVWNMLCFCFALA